ncbi:MAG: hypothetical protein BJ554DRAFT_8380 [Olpidium bornovanus]|uniref:Uncharacterized protein n=1 Tax=Olpidium bornovanus TaxID=278681 RepID=A0A8H7ZUQ2_9FUNG|nr:MAG: hypothetical protein BJ554DRAFT_8380 [Olpidium bornovanus]
MRFARCATYTTGTDIVVPRVGHGHDSRRPVIRVRASCGGGLASEDAMHAWITSETREPASGG